MRLFCATIRPTGLMSGLASLLLLLLLLSLMCCVRATSSFSSSDDTFDGETYSEETLIKGLPDGSLLSHYQFVMTKTIDSEFQDPREELLIHHLFPKAIGQVVLEFDVQEFHLSLTQGRWLSQKWGSCSPLPLAASPPGAEVYAWFRPSAEENDARTNDLWRGFTQSLSGMLCASFDFISSSADSQEYKFQPHYSFSAMNASLNGHNNFRYGAYSGEAMCTENSTPFFKLLPCRNVEGMASVEELRPSSLFGSSYHSLAVHFHRRRISPTIEELILIQSITTVIDPVFYNEEGYSLLDTVLPSSLCKLSQETKVLISIPKSVAGNRSPFEGCNLSFERKAIEAKSQKIDISTLSVDFLAIAPTELEQLDDRYVHYVFQFTMGSYFRRVTPSNIELHCPRFTAQEEHDMLYNPVFPYPSLGVSSTSPSSNVQEATSWRRASEHFWVRRYFTGTTAERGAIKIWMRNDDPTEALDLVYFDKIPSFLIPYFHTLRVKVNDVEIQPLAGQTKWRLTPPSTHISNSVGDDTTRRYALNKPPSIMELELSAPPKSVITISIEFDKLLLRWDEYPPDQARGFDVSAAIVTIRPRRTSSPTNSSFLHLGTSSNEVRHYTDSNTVNIPTPDFSMPFNVIMLTSTVVALAFVSFTKRLTQDLGLTPTAEKNVKVM